MSDATNDPVRGVVFDLDGTLGETLPVCFEAFRSVFQCDHGAVYSDSEIRAMFGPSELGVLTRNGSGDPDKLHAAYLQKYASFHHKADEPFPGILAVLEQLATFGVPIAVVTGKGHESAVLSLRHWGIEGFFTHVMTGSDAGDIKLDNMRHVVSSWGLDPGAVVAIGDIALDAERSRSAGLRPVSAAWSVTADPQSLAAAPTERVFSSVAQFWDWLEPQLAG